MKIYQVRADCVSDEGACGLFESPLFATRETAENFKAWVEARRREEIETFGLDDEVSNCIDQNSAFADDYANARSWIADDGHFKDIRIIEQELCESLPELCLQSDYFWCVHEGI